MITAATGERTEIQLPLIILARRCLQDEVRNENQKNNSSLLVVNCPNAEPSKASVRATDLNGSSVGSPQNRYNAELDPLGADNALADPGQIPLYSAPDDFSPGWLLPSSAGGKCKLDGMSIDCNEAFDRMAMGDAVPCPENNCGPRTYEKNGVTGVTNGFQALADGRQGFLPVGMTFAKGGIMMDSSWTGEEGGLLALDGAGFAYGFASSFTSGGNKKKRKSRPVPSMPGNDACNCNVPIHHDDSYDFMRLKIELAFLVIAIALRFRRVVTFCVSLLATALTPR